MKKLLPLLFLLFATNCFATTYYVANTGTDSNNGTSTSTPWATMGKVCGFTFAAGDIVLFNGGNVWAEQCNLSNIVGTPSSRILFSSYGVGRPIITGSGIRQYCFDAIGTTVKYLTLNNFECHDVTRQAVTFQTSAAGAMLVDIVSNFYIHNSGPGAFAGANSSNSCGSTPCDGFYTYANQLDFEDFNQNPDGVQFLNNTLTICGGHNCLQVHGDTGPVVIQGNKVGPGCHHGCIDAKAVGSTATPALIDSNISHCGMSTGQCYNEQVFGGNPEPAFYYENPFSPTSTVTYSRNLAYDSGVGFQACGGGCQSGKTCTSTIKYYNNTSYITGGGGSHFGLYAVGGTCNGPNVGSNTDPSLNARNNVWDGPAGGTAAKVANLSSITWDYNDDGGSQGGAIVGVATGAHDLVNINPLYIGPTTGSAPNFQETSVSPTINTGTANLVDSMTDIGYSQYTSIAPPAVPSAWSIGIF